MVPQHVVKGRWFAYVDLALVSASVVMWEIRPQLGWFPLLIALIPWLLRVVAGRFPFQRTGFEIPLLIFMLTAAVGVWVAYDPGGATVKFWLLFGGVLLYYALAAQPRENLWSIVGFLSMVGVGVAVYFLLTHDWQSSPAKFSLLNEIGLRWLKVRPSLRIEGIHPNAAGAVIAITTPFLVGLGMRAWNEKRALLGLWVILGGFVMAAAFLLATSRGAALALMAGLLVWSWWLLSVPLGRRLCIAPSMVFASGLLGLIVIVVGFSLVYSGGPVAIANAIPGPPSTGSRLELVESVIDLIGDFPYTGGGLLSFPGLYAFYIRDIPHYVTINGHNHYLDVSLEQGVLGALAFLAVYLGSLWQLLVRDWRNSGAVLAWATSISLLIIVLHGFTDNLVYGSWGAPLVFLVPGVASAVARSTPQLKTRYLSAGSFCTRLATRTHFRPLLLLTALGAIVSLLILFATCRQPLLAAWYADLGAVRMAKIELEDFGSGAWVEVANSDEMNLAEELFEKALTFDIQDRTANHRLGRIAAGRSEFPLAVLYLENAHAADRSHRGVRKGLGYTYVWSGQLDQAAAMLADIPEAGYELGVYSWWWGTKDRDDLAERAAAMVERLDSSGTDP